MYRGEWLQSAITRWAWSIFGVSRGTLLDAFGLSDLSEHEIRQLGQHASEDVLENIEESIGLPVDLLRRMTMEGAMTGGPEISRTGVPSIASRYLWARRTGTRYCPDCLLERPGVFYAAWRLNWTFACMRHERILLDACPECLLPLSESTARSRYLGDPNRCRANVGGGLPVTRCGADLTAAWDESPLPNHSFVLLTQAQITRAIDRADGGGLFHTLRGNVSALRAAGELDVVATLSGLPARELAGLVEAERRVGASAPNSAYATAALVTAAFMLTRVNDVSIGSWIRRVTFSRSPAPVPRGAGYGPGSPRELLTRWGQPDGAMREKILAAHDQDFTISQRLVYGSALSSVRKSVESSNLADGRPWVRVQHVPELLWTEWATPLDAGGPVTEWALRSALSAALRTVDTGEQLPEYVDRARTADARSEERVRRLTRLLRPKMIGAPRDADRLVRGITELAMLLHAHPSPIDYAKRTQLPWARILPKTHWVDICDAAAHNPGGEVRLRNARRYLFKRATQASPGALPTELAIGRHRQDAAEYSSFRAAVTLELQQGLDSYLLGILRSSGIEEPSVWAPSRALARTTASGRELDDIDWLRLHTLRAEGCTEARLAKELNRSIRHCLWAGDARPHPSAANVERVDWTQAFAHHVAG
ncbi:TniQ family protein [Curtobacterium sp. MCBA15_007]|uniref:TniQ family protein n=1 Tax=Curtobacterium sp. MCBA15_007 TaxID=1898735 RepID=UPI001587EDAB|nr:TniQ family protein [Curtobacterium sp. MCBA15_007]